MMRNLLKFPIKQAFLPTPAPPERGKPGAADGPILLLGGAGGGRFIHQVAHRVLFWLIFEHGLGEIMDMMHVFHFQHELKFCRRFFLLAGLPINRAAPQMRPRH